MKVDRYLIDQGHGPDNVHLGSYDSGAVSALGTEATVVRHLAMGLNTHRDFFVPIVYVPRTLLSKRIEWVNENSRVGDVLISLHMNEGGGTGTEVLVDDQASIERRAQGAILCAAVAGALGIHNRGVKLDSETPRGHLGLLEKTKCPAFIIEVGFIDSPGDMRRVTEDGTAAIVAGLRALRS